MRQQNELCSDETASRFGHAATTLGFAAATVELRQQQLWTCGTTAVGGSVSSFVTRGAARGSGRCPIPVLLCPLEVTVGTDNRGLFVWASLPPGLPLHTRPQPPFWSLAARRWCTGVCVCVLHWRVCVLHLRVCVVHWRVCVVHWRVCVWCTGVCVCGALAFVCACVCVVHWRVCVCSRARCRKIVHLFSFSACRNCGCIAPIVVLLNEG